MLRDPGCRSILERLRQLRWWLTPWPRAEPTPRAQLTANLLGPRAAMQSLVPSEQRPVEAMEWNPWVSLWASARLLLHPRLSVVRWRQWQVMLEAGIDEVGVEVARMVALVSDRWGQPPTRAEVAQAMGWSWWQQRSALRSLERSGWLVLGVRRRSVRPGLRGAGPEELTTSDTGGTFRCR